MNENDNYINITTSEDIDSISSIINKYAQLVINFIPCCTCICLLCDKVFLSYTFVHIVAHNYMNKWLSNIVLLLLISRLGSSCTETFNFPNFNIKAPTTPKNDKTLNLIIVRSLNQNGLVELLPYILPVLPDYVCAKMFLSWNVCVYDIKIMAPTQHNIYALKFPHGNLMKCNDIMTPTRFLSYFKYLGILLYFFVIWCIGEPIHCSMWLTNLSILLYLSLVYWRANSLFDVTD